MERLVANEKQIKSIKDYVSKRFGIYGVVSYKLKVEETPRLTYGQRISQDIELNSLGIFKHALKNCALKIEVWRRDKDSSINSCSIGLSYNHFDGGSNGCNIECFLNVDLECRVFEKYR